jgi:hypothetical protein
MKEFEITENSSSGIYGFSRDTRDSILVNPFNAEKVIDDDAAFARRKDLSSFDFEKSFEEEQKTGGEDFSYDDWSKKPIYEEMLSLAKSVYDYMPHQEWLLKQKFDHTTDFGNLLNGREVVNGSGKVTDSVLGRRTHPELNIFDL